MSEIAADVVWFLHVVFTAFVIVTPLVGSDPLLTLHALIVPFLMLHWLMNDDHCCLTLVECWFRGVDATRSFFHSLVSPVYKFGSDSALRGCAWIVTIVLWIITLVRLSRQDPPFDLARKVLDILTSAFR